MSAITGLEVAGIRVEDIRFRFQSGGPGSDANNPRTDYSNPLVTVRTVPESHVGVGVGFTLGRGNDMVCQAVRELAPILEGAPLEGVLGEFGLWWRKLANPLQARWIGPGCGPYHMAAGAIANALFDLWAKLEGRPLWRLLADLDAERVVSLLDLRYVEHHLDRTRALEILRAAEPGKAARAAQLEATGLPCYHTTWIGQTTTDLVEEVRRVRAQRGIDAFKVKVGSSLEHDHERLSALRRAYGDEIRIYTDANQVWSVSQAIRWMRDLALHRPLWIEEPVAPDLVEGHRRVRDGLRDLGIHVVTGENCPNSHLAAELMAGGAVDRFQVDACRVLGPPEDILILLVAAHYGIPVCPHAGGSGLDELAPHLAAWNYVCARPSLEAVVVEQVGFCGHHFLSPARVADGRLRVPTEPGYLVGMREESRREYAFPRGAAWSAPGGPPAQAAGAHG
jgi:L-fuconate dehydratase